MARDRLTETSIVKLAPKDAAAVFVARAGGEGLNADEELVLANWLKKNVTHRQEYENAERVWKTFVNISGDEIQAALRAQAAVERPKRKITWKTVIVTTVIVLLSALATFLFVIRGQNSLAVTVVPYTTLRTQLKQEKLPDGSEIDLDADSIVVGRFGPIGRRVELQRGRALFSVSPDRVKPFVVTAGDRSIIAVGTRFDVNLLDGGLIVTLLDGHVVVDSTQGGAPTVLDTGQQFVERGGKIEIRTLGAAAKAAADWRAGVANFDDQPLSEVVQIMNRYTLDDVVVRDPAVGWLRVSGQFKTGDAPGFAEKVAEAHSLELVRNGKQIELKLKIG